MKVAYFLNEKFIIDSIYKLYPHISFPETGVPDSFLQEKNLFKVIDHIEHNSAYKTLINLDTPKLIDGSLYTVELIDKSFTEINNNRWKEKRKIRDDLLKNSDIYVLSDRWENYDQITKDLWTKYRQKLRDLPQNHINPDDVVWPMRPNQ